MSRAPRSYNGKVLAAFAAVVSLVGAMPAAGEDLLQVTEAQALKAVKSKVEPAYPPMAKELRLSGKVSVSAVVNASGKVEKVDIDEGNLMLGRACVVAVEKWKFNAFETGGKPVRAVVHLAFSFQR